MANKIDNPTAWHVQWPEGVTLCGPRKYVDFTYGQGVLSLYSLKKFRPDWVEEKDGKLKQVRGLAIAEYATYFQKRGCTVKPMAEDEAMELMDALAKDPEKFKPVEPEPESKEAAPDQPTKQPRKGKKKDAGKEADPDKEAEPVPPHEK